MPYFAVKIYLWFFFHFNFVLYVATFYFAQYPDLNSALKVREFPKLVEKNR